MTLLENIEELFASQHFRRSWLTAQIDVVHIGAKFNNTWDLVVDAPQYLPQPTACHAAAHDIDPTEPDKCDVIRLGEEYGKERAQSRLVNNAQDATSHDVPGLTPYYDSV